jgi:hypothetical protein
MARDARDAAIASAVNKYKAGALQQYAGKRYKATGEPREQGEVVRKQDQAIAIALSQLGEGRKAKQARTRKRVVPGSTAAARKKPLSPGGGGGGW